MKNKKQPMNPQSGLSLLEVVVVVIIIAGILALVGPNIFKQYTQSQARNTKSQIELLSTALDTFRLEIGRYPTEEEGLQALVAQPEGLGLWNGPYLRKKTLPRDGWGNEFVYANPPVQGGIDYDLSSLGADGKPGGAENDKDIGNWE